MSNKNCTTCLNSHTPICDTCKQTEYQDRIIARSHWEGDELTEVDTLSFEDVSAIIRVRAEANKPIPIHFVIKYNRYLLEDNDNE